MIRTLCSLPVSLIALCLAGGKPASAETAPGITAAPASLTFPITNLGSHAAAKVVTFKNAGSTAVTSLSIALIGAAASAYSKTQTCGATLAAGASCTVSVTFDPKISGGLAATLRVIGSGSSSASVPIQGVCSDLNAVAPDANTYKFSTTQGDIYVEFRPDAAPKNVANFLYYVNNGTYAHSIFHRVVAAFVNQGGGYKLDNAGQVIMSPTAAPVVNEFKLSNLRGTIAMARTTDPNSATDEFFFNVQDNKSLDTQTGGFTVIAQIVGVQGVDAASQSVSLAVMDAINSDPIYNFGSPFDSIPLIFYTSGTKVVPANFVYINSITRVKPKTGAPATPVFSIKTGTYKGPQTVRLTDSNPKASIYYYLFGSASKNPVKYTGPFTVSKSQYAVAYAVAPGYSNDSYLNYEYFGIKSSP
jgi:cyclophilin family peptidyl-prolyl cis-trans isomerase